MPYFKVISRNRTQCSSCSLKDLCLPVGLPPDGMELLDELIDMRKQLKKGEFLFKTEQDFSSLFAVRTGFFKTNVASQDGREQVTGFYMSGELIGLDGISANKHTCNAVALEDSEVCELPFADFESLIKRVPELHRHFMRLMSNEIVRDQATMLLLSNMKAEERIATFLMNLSQRLKYRGFAANDFILRMSREEIGSFLGLKLETVSRTLSKFNQQGLIKVDHKHIQLIKVDELNKIIEGARNIRV